MHAIAFGRAVGRLPAGPSIRKVDASNRQGRDRGLDRNEGVMGRVRAGSRCQQQCSGPASCAIASARSSRQQDAASFAEVGDALRRLVDLTTVIGMRIA